MFTAAHNEVLKLQFEIAQCTLFVSEQELEVFYKLVFTFILQHVICLLVIRVLMLKIHT